MAMSSHLLKRAIGLWKAGQNIQARRILESILYNDRQNESAWTWYIYTLETNTEKIAALETFLTIFPDHATGRKALVTLKAQASQPEAQQARIPVKMQDAGQPPGAPALRPTQQMHLPHTSSTRSVPLLLLVSGLCMLLFSTITLLVRYHTLQVEHADLIASSQLTVQELTRLNSDYEELRVDNAGLTNEYNTLVNQYNTLNYEYSTLLGNYNTLSAEHTNLKNTYDSLLTDYNYTVQSYSAFREIAIAPPYIYTRERKVHLVFVKLDGSLLRWTIDSDWLEHHLRLGDQLREHLTYDLSLYNEYTDEVYNVVDDRDFVDVTPFTNLMADLYYSSPDDYTFIREVWNIVAQLTAYTSEIQETPRFPMETLLSGGGDCEDHAILFASMILASPVPWEVQFIYMDAYHPTRPEDMNHVIVQVITANGPYLVEATSKMSMDPYTEGVYGWSYSINGRDR